MDWDSFLAGVHLGFWVGAVLTMVCGWYHSHK